MADVSSTLRAWSATASSNSPSGGTVIGAGLDDNLRAIQAVVRQFLASQATNMASAATVDLSTADGFYINVTGTAPITALGTEGAGIHYLLKFAAALTFTHNGTSLILPAAANITTAAGDMAWVVSEGSGNWRCLFFTKASGRPILVAAGDFATQTANTFLAGPTSGSAATPTFRVLNSADISGVYPALGTPVATTSGTSKDFTVPSTARRHTVCFKGVSTNGTSSFLIQIGVGTPETTVYTSAVASSLGAGVSTSTAGFIVAGTMGASDLAHGAITLTLESSANNTWVASGNLHLTVTAAVAFSAGSKSAAGAITLIRVTMVNGTDAFDAGEINVVSE